MVDKGTYLYNVFFLADVNAYNGPTHTHTWLLTLTNDYSPPCAKRTKENTTIVLMYFVNCASTIRKYALTQHGSPDHFGKWNPQ